MSCRTGLRALAHSLRTLPGVSSPASVVRSMHVTARSSHAACQSFLIERRFWKVAARRSVALRLTRVRSTHPISRGIPGLRESSEEVTLSFPPAGRAACLNQNRVHVTRTVSITAQTHYSARERGEPFAVVCRVGQLHLDVEIQRYGPPVLCTAPLICFSMGGSEARPCERREK